MGRVTFEKICEELNSAIAKEDTTLRSVISVRQRVAVCLWRLATGDPLSMFPEAPKTSVSAYFNKRHTERTQKSCYSVTIQGVVNHKGVFTDMCIGWPLSLRDNEVLEKSALFQMAHCVIWQKSLAITVALSVVSQKFLPDSNQHSLPSTSVMDCHVDIRSRTLTCETLNNHDLAKCFKTLIVE
ncbi:hypothetical protein Fmac_027587 [Flemingia macrophylla]|uniref:DDE Tnp4 domain-containing protein n=1 Tax=Flemingia macrophylla TaxID=520843 RepID=A0ABD1LIN1_9FABA